MHNCPATRGIRLTTNEHILHGVWAYGYWFDFTALESRIIYIYGTVYADFCFRGRSKYFDPNSRCLLHKEVLEGPHGIHGSQPNTPQRHKGTVLHGI
jgi:hypothetical protein